MPVDVNSVLPGVEETTMVEPPRKRKRRLRLFGSAPYLGEEQQVDLMVHFGDRTLLVECKYRDEAEGRTIVVRADVTGQEGRYHFVTECLDRLRDQHEAEQGEPATKMLVMAWEKALNETWGRALL